MRQDEGMAGRGHSLLSRSFTSGTPAPPASLLRHRFRLGRLDYSFGSDPVFEVFKCARHFRDTPSPARLRGQAGRILLVFRPPRSPAGSA